MKMLRAAVIDCGLIFKNHSKALKNVEHVCCTAVCDIDPDKAQAAAEIHGIHQVYSDYKELLKDPDIDTVHICTPHYLHARMAIDALRTGKHVLYEKPVALTKENAKQMLEARERRGKHLGICFQDRYNQVSIYMKQLMDQGTLGRVLGARGQVTWDRKPKYYGESPWRGRWITEGDGVLINQAIHTFDLFQWLTGCRVTTVDASISARRLKGVTEVEGTVDILMTGEAGERLIFYATNCYVKNVPVELEIVYEHGSVKMTGNAMVTNQDGTAATEDYSSGTVLGKDHWDSGYGFLISDFYHCIQEGRSFPVGGEKAIISVGFLEAVYRSTKVGVPVKLGRELGVGEHTIKTGKGGCTWKKEKSGPMEL